MREDGSRSPAPQAALRRNLRRQLEQAQPPLRVIAEDVLADGSRIDWVARDPLGAVSVILVGEAGEDLELFTRGLAHRSWVEQRIPDWRQLAPELELSPGVSVLLLCPDFRAETIAAARSIEPLVQLVLYRDRGLQNAPGPIALEPVGQLQPEAPVAPAATSPQRESPPPEPDSWLEDTAREEPLSRPSEFRSGLSEDDLQITPEERREFG